MSWAAHVRELDQAAVVARARGASDVAIAILERAADYATQQAAKYREPVYEREPGWDG